MSGCKMKVWKAEDDCSPCGKRCVAGTQYCSKHLEQGQEWARKDYKKALGQLSKAERELRAAGLLFTEPR